ncbi:MAG: cytochrome c [Nitrospiraceae bacterium]|nr:cytochrome c [Nitrospiraceae bacterium]
MARSAGRFARLSILSLILCGPTLAGPTDAGVPEQKPQLGAQAEAGRNIFNGVGRCSTCHGLDAVHDQLPSDLSPNLRKTVAAMNPPPSDLRNRSRLTLATDKQRFDVIRHGRLRTAMHPISEAALSDEQILSLLAYLAALRQNGTHEAPTKPASAPAGDIASGQRLFHELGGCYICHGLEGNPANRPKLSDKLRQELARLQPPPTDLRNLDQLKTSDDLERFRSIKYGHPGTAMFPKKLLRDEDIWDLIAYIDTLPNAKR